MKNLKILCIDDEVELTKLMKDLLHDLGIETVHECNNKQCAIDFAHKNDYDVIMVDVRMPNFSVEDYVKRFQRKANIIITTGYASADIYNLGFPVLQKPFNFDTLFQSLYEISSQKGELLCSSVLNC